MKFTAALMPGVENVLGIRLPVLRKIARQIAAGDWRTYLAEAEDFYFEERMLQGLVIGCARCTPAEKLEHVGALRAQNQQLGGLRLFLLAPEGGRTAADVGIHTALFPIRSQIRRAFRRGDGAGEFRRRGSTSRHCCNCSTASATKPTTPGWPWHGRCRSAYKIPQRTHEWLGSCSLDDWTFNKSLQKIVESLRASDTDKQAIRAMKRRKQATSRAAVNPRPGTETAGQAEKRPGQAPKQPTDGKTAARRRRPAEKQGARHRFAK